MKTVCIILGTVSLALGIIGIFLPLEQSHPSTCQNHLPTADVGNNGLLHLLLDSTNRNKDSIVPCRCGGDLAYTVIQDVEINECANVVNVLMCQ